MIVITTPRGQIGHQVLANLLDSGEALRAIDRDPSELPTEIRERVEIVEGSHGRRRTRVGRRLRLPTSASPGLPPRRSSARVSSAS
jgi:nucleoside-diphosphate-sugar epimerase